MKKLNLFFLVLISLASLAQTPTSYWPMERKSSLNFIDSTGLYNLNMTNYSSTYTNPTGGAVGSYLSVDTASSLILGSTASTVISGSFTFEMWIKPNKFFMGCSLFGGPTGVYGGGFRTPTVTGSSIPSIYFTVNSTELNILLDGINRKSFGYYVDGAWHQLVFSYNSSTGEKKIYVDGQCPLGFYVTQAGGSVLASGGLGITFSALKGGADWRRYTGGMDEVAYWNSVLSPQMVLEHYNNVKAGVHYKYSTLITSFPSSPNYTAIERDTNSLPPTGVDFMKQLLNAPMPRYKSTHHLKENIFWLDPRYASGSLQSGISESTAIANSVTIQNTLANYYNYMLTVATADNSGAFNSQWIANANANPGKKVHTKTFRIGAGGALTNQNYSNDKYLQNEGGQFLNANGVIVTAPNKVWRPTVDSSYYIADGRYVAPLVGSLRNLLTRPLNLINEDGEVLGDSYESACLLDPVVVAAAAARGLTMRQYIASRFAKQEIASYRDTILHSLPAGDSCKWTMYKMCGFPQYQFDWPYARLIMSPMDGQYYATCDLYPKYGPSNCRGYQSAWHGIEWILGSRGAEIGLGDKLFSPFVAAGWDADVWNHIRPAQWEGMLKIMLPLGMEFMYSAYFDEAASYTPPNPPPNHPNTYIWQTVVPSYVQALNSYCEDILRNGAAMEGDFPVQYDPPNPAAGYNFFCGDERKVVTARKYGTKYLIASTINQVVNYKGTIEDESNTTIALDGTNITFKTRRQGSVYILDKSDSTFYQLDGWHENTHPNRWTMDINMEAEVCDSTTGSRKTTYTTPYPNLTNFKTVVMLDSSEYVIYKVLPRDISNKCLFIKASGTGNLSIKLNSATAQTRSITTNGWYKINLGSLSTTVASTIRITSLKTHSIDSLCVTSNETKYTATDLDCSFVPSITGILSVCGTGSTTLTETAGSTWLWSNGATTASIHVPSGLYTVTATSSGCTASSSASVVTKLVPDATIIKSPATLCTGSSATLSTSTGTGYTYLWNTGATTSSILITSSATYSVTITLASCSATGTTTTTFSDCEAACSVPNNLIQYKIFSNAVTVRWDVVASATSGYRIYIKDILGTTKSVDKLPTDANPGQKKIFGLLPSRRYDIWIKSLCANSTSSGSSTVLQITTTAQ